MRDGARQLANVDDCAAAEADTFLGTGLVGYSNGAATTGAEGQAELNCYEFGTSGVENDIWFNWVPDVTGMATIHTCLSVGIDSKLAAYPGGNCPADGSSLDCNDDTCGLLSEISFPVEFGECYLIQVGSFPGGTPGAGTLDISIAPLPPIPVSGVDDCAFADTEVQVGPGSLAMTLGTTGAEGQNEAFCYAFGLSGIDNDVWFTYFATSDGDVRIETCASAAGDSKLAVYPGGIGCPADGTSLACNDDICSVRSGVNFPAKAGQSYLVQLGNFPGGSGTAFTLDIIESGAGNVNLGANYCPNNANSTGSPGRIGAVGSASLTDNNLYLCAIDLPCDEFGYFVAGDGQGFVDLPMVGLSNGFFCIGGTPMNIGRFDGQVGNTGISGSLTIRVDVNAVPVADTGVPMDPGVIALLPGDWYFQCWYRNDGGNNFTDATCVTFVP
ncbi:MAG: hypothetical protein GY711_00720 [bacterium]|nr:hypothetical protein [bacterium]